MTVKPSAYIPNGQSLEMLAMALNTYASDLEVKEKLDTATVDVLAIEWAQAAQAVKHEDQLGDKAIAMTEAAHLLILGILRDTTIITTACIARATGLMAANDPDKEPDTEEPATAFEAKQQQVEEADKEPDTETDFDSDKAEIIGASVRSLMAPGYNLEAFIADYTVHGEELVLSEKKWRQLTHEYGPQCTAVMLWFGAKYYEVHWHGEAQPVEVEVTERAPVN